MSELNAPHRGLSLGELFPELAMPRTVAQITVCGVALDSRTLREGDLFIALTGERVDGAAFIDAAIAQGARAIAVAAHRQRQAGNLVYRRNIPVIAVAELAERVSAIAGHCWGDPSAALPVFGVTGTNGKSTCVSLIAQLQNLLGRRCGSIGTLGLIDGDETLAESGMTTPDAVTCQYYLKQLRERGARSVAMEVSSHGLAQHRVAGIKFQAAVFTNITHDHLDYHQTLDNYVAAKLKLFETAGLKCAVVNLDDPFAAQMLQAAKKQARVLTYSLLHFAADVYASDLHYTADGVTFRLQSPWGEASIGSPLLGEFNVYNLIAAISAVCQSEADFRRIVNATAHLSPVAGRMQRVSETADVSVIVDFAHTPDALAQAIAAARRHTAGRLWVVFGCGGDRDKAKRPLMAAVAEKYGDRVVLTSDNPRSEDPEAIMADIARGVVEANYLALADRREAIVATIQRAAPTDVVLLAGKGHEKYQIVGEHKRPFDEIAIAREALRSRRIPSGGGGRACD